MKRIILFTISILLIVTSCKQIDDKFSICVSDESIDINSVSCNEGNILHIQRISDYRTTHLSLINGKLSKENPDSITIPFSANYSINILELLKSDTRPYDIALQLIETNQVCYHLRINNSVDTLIYIKPNIESQIDIGKQAYIEKGICAKLYSKVSAEQNTTNIREWLYDNNLHKDDPTISKIEDIVAWLKWTSKFEYETTEDIPVVKNFSAIPYKVKTNFKTDYYYLFATNNQQGLDEFIKEVCITNFEGGETNINNTLSCYRQKDKGGLLCIFLIGLNKDWSKIVLPLGLIAVDNELPNIISDNNVDKTEFFRTDGTSFLDKPNKQTEQPYIVDSMMIHIPQNIPDIDGQVMILTKPFRGNHANFELRFGGDIKSISIKREIHRSYMRYSLKPETKVISLENKRSPYYFTYELDLGIGDNYIPIQVTDKRGNKSDYTYKISMVSVENETPQINIDNNIDVWN